MTATNSRIKRVTKTNPSVADGPITVLRQQLEKLREAEPFAVERVKAAQSKLDQARQNLEQIQADTHKTVRILEEHDPQPEPVPAVKVDVTGGRESLIPDGKMPLYSWDKL